jgi:hypothetical protein
VALLDVEAAAISLVFDGTSGGALGASDAARKYDELQFRFGEGPCRDAVTQRILMLVVDLIEEPRSPASGPAMLVHGGPRYAAAAHRFLADRHQLVDRVCRQIPVDERHHLHFGQLDCALVVVEERDVGGITPGGDAH